MHKFVAKDNDKDRHLARNRRYMLMESIYYQAEIKRIYYEIVEMKIYRSEIPVQKENENAQRLGIPVIN